MNVELIDFTGAGYDQPARRAATILIFAKNTRVKMSPNGFDEIDDWPEAKRQEELAYIAKTIPGSWEFVHLTFMVQDVTRGFTHQFVRTRTASFAQQSQQVNKMEGWQYMTGPTIATVPYRLKQYAAAMKSIDAAYSALIEDGADVDDARGLLPTNVLTNIVASMNLRTFVDIVRTRTSPRNRGEYREVAELMRDVVIEALPWAKLFLDSDADQAGRELDNEIAGLEMYSHEERMVLHKLVDRMRRG